jgi:hypothetical protein
MKSAGEDSDCGAHIGDITKVEAFEKLGNPSKYEKESAKSQEEKY